MILNLIDQEFLNVNFDLVVEIQVGAEVMVGVKIIVESDLMEDQTQIHDIDLEALIVFRKEDISKLFTVDTRTTDVKKISI